MSIEHIPLFPADTIIGAGFHNIGSGVLRGSDTATIKKIESHYGERCGHIPLQAQHIRLLVKAVTPAITSQAAYLSRLFGKEVRAVDEATFRQESAGLQPLVIPYVNVPEAESYAQQTFGATVWGLPGRMVHNLKNKADFYTLVDEAGLDDFVTPDYTIASVFNAARTAEQVLKEAEALYMAAGVSQHYPLGVVMRASESDGNYGCSIVYARGQDIVLIEDGDAEHPFLFRDWHKALTQAQAHLVSTMNPEKEERVVLSRYLDFMDSPGMSVVIINGEVESLGWNGQLQLEGSTACVGTSSYIPRTEYIRQMQEHFEAKTTDFFVALLKKTAARHHIPFTQITGVANIDIMLPSHLEQRVQKHRKQPAVNYLAECNPRWTNYTDAILTVLGATRRTPTVASMRAVIREGIFTIDKHCMPAHIEPSLVREYICEHDERLRERGTRIICRMNNNPMGLILAGDTSIARQTISTIVEGLSQAV